MISGAYSQLEKDVRRAVREDDENRKRKLLRPKVESFKEKGVVSNEVRQPEAQESHSSQ